jgi:hypothetical protein
MLAALGMGEVGTVILVDCQTETTFEGADVVLEKVRVFVEIDGFKGEFAQALATVGMGRFFGGDTTATELGPGAILIIHVV